MSLLFPSMLIAAALVQSVPRANASRHLLLQPGADLQQVAPGKWESSSVDPGIAWTDFVPSWDADGTERGASVEVLVNRGEDSFTFGKWSLAPEKGLRSSVNKQKKPAGDLYTDTFVPKAPGGPVRLTVLLHPGWDGSLPRLNWLRIAFSAGVPAPSPWNGIPIKPLEVPIRAQGDYPGGGVLCSPTSVSMVLWYWANQLGHKELDADVPEAKACIWDPAWNGTGNWAFNVAFASSRPGLEAYVARLRDADDIEAWLRKGVPVVASVSYDLLKGKDKRGDNDGHLVVVVGTNESGDFIFNDPGKKPNRLVYSRAAFERAWASSGNTCYLIHPQLWQVPELP